MRALLVWILFLAPGLDWDLPRLPAVVIQHPASSSIDDDIPRGVENSGLVCTALAVYAEARGESWFGQALVARVVLNRQLALGPGADACDVINEPGQFEGIANWPYPRHPWSDDRRAWDMALDVATAVMTDDYYVPPPCQRATHFRARDTPGWSDLQLICTVGAHDFYAPGKGATVVTASTPGPQAARP